MSAFVVDASVVIKWFVPEIHSDAAQRLLDRSHAYFAPDLLFAETANTRTTVLSRLWRNSHHSPDTSNRSRRVTADLAGDAVRA